MYIQDHTRSYKYIYIYIYLSIMRLSRHLKPRLPLWLVISFVFQEFSSARPLICLWISSMVCLVQITASTSWTTSLAISSASLLQLRLPWWFMWPSWANERTCHAHSSCLLLSPVWFGALHKWHGSKPIWSWASRLHFLSSVAFQALLGFWLAVAASEKCKPNPAVFLQLLGCFCEYQESCW